MRKEHIDKVQRDINKNKFSMDPKNPTFLELCRIESVNEENMTVTAYLLESRYIVKDISFQFPFYYDGYGIMFTPVKGSLGIVARAAKQLMLLMYAAPETVNKDFKVSRDVPNLGYHGLPRLKPGEILVKSKTGAFIYLDTDSNLTMSSGAFATIRLDKDGKIDLDGEEIELTTNGSIKEIYMNEYEPYMEIIKGKHSYKSIHEPEDSIELVYRINIERENTNTFFGLDLDGNIHTNFSGKIIRH